MRYTVESRTAGQLWWSGKYSEGSGSDLFQGCAYRKKTRNPVTEDHSVEPESGDIQSKPLYDTKTVAWHENSQGPASTSRLVSWIQVVAMVSEVKAVISGEYACFRKPFGWRVSLSLEDTDHFTRCLTSILLNYTSLSRCLFVLRTSHLYCITCIISIPKPTIIRAFYRPMSYATTLRACIRFILSYVQYIDL
jgi:hypothetical protein